MDKKTKLSFTFTSDDMRAIRKVQDKMAITQGKVTHVAAIRAAVRLMAKA